MTALVRRGSIEELCGHRARALELYKQGVATLHDAMRAHAQAQPTADGRYISMPNDLKRALSYGDADDATKFADAMRIHVDRDMWRSLINYTGLHALMDTEERKKFDKDLEGIPPEVTPDNVEATLKRLAGEGDMIFRRGLVNAFTKLSRDYKSNDGFKLGERIVTTYGCSFDKSCNWWRLGEYAEATIRDVDRVMHVLDGKPAPEYQQGICAAIRTAMSDYRRGGGVEVATEYWRAKFFKNGNIHLWPLRKDLIDKANKIIAEHFGMTVAAPPEHTGRPFEAPPKEYGCEDQDFFASTEVVVEQVMELAEIGNGMSVLEPSAGEGALAEAAQHFTDFISCVEINADRVKALCEKGFIAQQRDFLQDPPLPHFDRVVMNPPFSKGQDIRHVIHAWKFLKPGGRLVAVMSAGIEFRNDKLHCAFRAWVQQQGGTIRKLPAGAFTESGTGVNAIILVVEKPA